MCNQEIHLPTWPSSLNLDQLHSWWQDLLPTVGIPLVVFVDGLHISILILKTGLIVDFLLKPACMATIWRIIRPNWGVRLSHFVTKILWLTVKHITHKCIYAVLYLKIYLHYLKLWVRDSKVVGSCEVTTGLPGPPQLHSAGAEISGNNSVVLHAFCHRKFRKQILHVSIHQRDWHVEHKTLIAIL